MKIKRHNILQVVNDDLCMGCGACTGVCPVDAIAMDFDEKIGQFLPQVDIERCTDCGNCIAVCAGAEIDFIRLGQDFLSGEGKKDIFLGKFRSVYTGCAVDPSIRLRAASGGVTTQILATLLDQGLIDGAWVVRPNKQNWKRPIRFLAKSKEELMSTCGSLYQPTTGIGESINYIINTPGRYAFVGLPCHIAGIRKAQAMSKFLRERVLVVISLFCFGTANANGTECFFYLHSINSKKVLKVSYRYGSWPGKVHIVLKNGQERSFKRGPELGKMSGFTNKLKLAKFASCFYHYFYMPRCFSCIDGIGELADIACGDPWLPEFSNDQDGSSLFIVRSEIGEKVLNLCLQRKEIVCTPIEPSRVIESQGGCIERNMDIDIQESVVKKFGRKPPVYDWRKTSVLRYGPSLKKRSKQFSKILIGRKRWLWALLPWMELYIYYRSRYLRLPKRIVKKMFLLVGIKIKRNSE